MGFLSKLFGPRDPETRAKRLIRDLTYRSDCAASLAAEIDRFEQANPMLAALGNAFGGIGIGGARTSAALNNFKKKKRRLELAHEGERAIRAGAALKLGEVRHPRAVQALIAALEDKYPLVRSNAAKALGALRDSQAIDALTRRSQDPKEPDLVRQSASQALETLKQRQGSISEPRSTARPSPAFEGVGENPSAATFAETLSKGLGQILETGQFETVSTTSADEAISVLFDRALVAVPSLTVDAVESNYERVKGNWSSRKLVRGPQNRVRSIVLANLRRIQSQAGFRNFQIAVYLERGAAQVEAMAPPHFIPIAVWRSGDDVFACGNADFRE